SQPPAAATAEVEGPITAGAGPVVPQPAVPAPDDWVTEEFFVGGTATGFEAVGDLGDDGVWDVEPADTADYRTRILVRRPPESAFSGVVVVEWMNVTATEASPDWAYLAEEVVRSGHAYVLVSVQSLGVIGGEPRIAVEIDDEAAEDLGEDADDLTGGLVNADPERYGTLAHPGDGFAFDIFSQVGRAVTDRADLVMGGLEPTTVIAIGESQSAGFLSTYLNAIHPDAGVYDGFLVHSRGGGAAPVSGSFSGSGFVEDGARIRTDLEQPVLIFEAETDLTLLGYHRARQPDTDMIRTWEVAGTAHADAHLIRAILGGPRDGGVGSFLGCDAPINTGPHHEVLSAALRRLVEWVRDGTPPPTGAQLALVEGDPVAIARDDLGRAVGGVRNPLVDVPVVVTTGDPPPGVASERGEGFDICALFGRTLPLDTTTLLELHGSADDYVAAFEASAAAAVDAGFLLAEDAEQLVAEAEANRALFG
ncbi:MAG: hypothetical protein GWN07_31985, partial [Actinobacteria bacterium]|nr:hypothetical protein [Actinomycetota bacterium]NIU70050.1 hypothetical protein [Actinomycetota bacterium]NIV89785.1 hypothetical protein [Actinomycetota bacterium]NIX24187.1 hypothetical protein [Actinomycetota bacterium]